MRFTITGKNNVVLDEWKEKTEKKLGRLKKLFPENTPIQVTLSTEKLDHIVEVSIPLKKRYLRAVSKSHDMSAAIDEVVDLVEKQMIKYKSRLRRRVKNDYSLREEYSQLSHIKDDEESNPFKIEKQKRFALKPMDAEEAVMEMELLNHEFFVFRDSETDEVNVVYKRRNGSYGLIEPEY